MQQSADTDREASKQTHDGSKGRPLVLAVNGLTLFISHVALFILGILFGVVLLLLLSREASGTVRAAPPSQANVVLVISTATPSAAATEPQQVAQPTAATSAQIVPDVPVSETLAGARDYTRLGSPSAPVQIVVFADPQCPFCRQLVLGPERQTIIDYVNTGKAAITYRHYAFLGLESTRAAEAMECAGRQGSKAFWDFHAQIFENQLPENSGQLTDAKLLEWAKSAGLDTAKLSACVAAGNGKAAVDVDMQAAGEMSVSGTPVTFVNGHRLVGAVPYDFIKTAIDAELATRK